MTAWQGNAFRPFCSERCKLQDLSNWAEERYRITAPAADDESDAQAVPADDDGDDPGPTRH